jgi:hypothetical protein
MFLDIHKSHCPHCAEVIELVIDPSADQEYIEDCQVCCCPMIVRVTANANESKLEVVVFAED